MKRPYKKRRNEDKNKKRNENVRSESGRQLSAMYVLGVLCNEVCQVDGVHSSPVKSPTIVQQGDRGRFLREFRVSKLSLQRLCSNLQNKKNPTRFTEAG